MQSQTIFSYLFIFPRQSLTINKKQFLISEACNFHKYAPLNFWLSIFLHSSIAPALSATISEHITIKYKTNLCLVIIFVKLQSSTLLTRLTADYNRLWNFILYARKWVERIFLFYANFIIPQVFCFVPYGWYVVKSFCIQTK